MAQDLKLIPVEMLEIIPQFDGNYTFLNNFIKKVEYVIDSYKGVNNLAQDEYVFFAVSSRLTGIAAEFLGSRADLKTWDDLKTFLCQHFSDPRSEENIRIDLENLRMGNSESYIEFCNRIKHVKSTLMAKVNETDDASMIRAKTEIYDKSSLNTFLYNLPESIVWMVRAKGCKTLDEALAVVKDEMNFQVQYNSKRYSRAMPNSFLSAKSQQLTFGGTGGCGAAVVRPGNALGVSSVPALPASSSGGPRFGQGQSIFGQDLAIKPAHAQKSVFDTMAPTQQNWGPIFPDGKTTPAAKGPIFPDGKTTPAAKGPIFPDGKTTPAAKDPIFSDGKTTPATKGPIFPDGKTTLEKQQ